MKKLLLATFAMLVVTEVAYAETGPCQEKGLEQKVACLNVIVGKLQEQVANLASNAKVDEVKTTADQALRTAMEAKGAAGGALKEGENVRIEWAAHPGVCLYFKDWTTNLNQTYSVLGCDGADGYRMRIRR